MNKKVPDLRRVYDSGEARAILKQYGYHYSHTASESRYVSKKIGYGICEPYIGLYGEGVIVRRAETRAGKNPLHSQVEYWLEVIDDDKTKQGFKCGCIRRQLQHGRTAKDTAAIGKEGK